MNTNNADKSDRKEAFITIAFFIGLFLAGQIAVKMASIVSMTLWRLLLLLF